MPLAFNRPMLFRYLQHIWQARCRSQLISRLPPIDFNAIGMAFEHKFTFHL
jgi:hypothetical protein